MGGYVYSPSGGGISLFPGQSCPAWDFAWVIPESEYEGDKEFRFRVRLVYKQSASDGDVLDEYRKVQRSLDFEPAPDMDDETHSDRRG